MTLEEAKAVATIISQADGGCPYCVESLREMCAEAFPDFVWTPPADYMENVTVEARAAS